jgi:hypothetical protein
MGGYGMKRVFFVFMFCLITLILAYWAAASKIVGGIKEFFKKKNNVRWQKIEEFKEVKHLDRST